jgi:2-oxoglutarate ferredoxin oxidoreductase subunit alpha
MPEGLGFAAITEAPGPVVVIYQRGGPSTGLPTRQEQGDLLFAVHAGQGDIPRIVMASGDIEECFYDTFDAFNYADRYQLPVLLLVDKHLASCSQTLPPFKTSHLRVDRGLIHDATRNGNGANGDYLRYEFTRNGISARAIPGTPGGIFWSTTDEHDPRGHITEGIGNRMVMMQKRMGKLALAAREIPDEKKFSVFGPTKGRTPVVVVGWGSTKGAIVDALRRLDPHQENYCFIQIRMMRPFPAGPVKRLLESAGKVISLDCNYSGQIAELVRAETGFDVHHRIVKYDGRPFSEDEIVTALEAALASGDERMIVSEGKVVSLEYGREQFDEMLELRQKHAKMQAPMVPLPPGYNR